MRRHSSSAAAGIDARLRRLEEASGAAARARDDARMDAALRLLRDEDLTGLLLWVQHPETRPGSECPAPLVAAWQSAWERAGGTLPR